MNKLGLPIRSREAQDNVGSSQSSQVRDQECSQQTLQSQSQPESKTQSQLQLQLQQSETDLQHPKNEKPTISPCYDKHFTIPKLLKEPLSLKFIHKPSRSTNFFEKAEDPTRRNSIINSMTSDRVNPITNLTTNNTTTANVNNLTTETDEINSETELTSSIDTMSEFDDEHKLVRKKSGELVKPSLRISSEKGYFNKKRTQSLPTTPTYKLVHFGTGNDVRYFKKQDRPTAISASNSPTFNGSSMNINLAIGSDDESYDDGESDLDLDEAADLTMDLNKKGSTIYKRDRIDWHLNLPNFPHLSYDRKIFQEKCKVFLERMFISIDKKYLLGHIAVKNLAFEKSIMVRYTLDNWSTIIEIPTIYVPDIPQILKKNEYDRFIFKIPLGNLFNSFRMMSPVQNSTNPNEKKFQLCVKYNAKDSEYWDNNNYQNYEFQLTKINKNGSQPPAQKLDTLQNHTAKPKYSSSFLKRRLSDSTLEVNKTHNESATESSPDTYFESSPSFTSHILGTNNSMFNYNFSFANGSNLSMDDFKNNSYLISPILSVNKQDKKNLNTMEELQLNDCNTSPNDENKRLSPSTEFSKLSVPYNHKETANAMDSQSYKKLLDTYCFFKKPKEDENDGKSKFGSDRSLTTVSSALGFHD